MTYLLDTHGFLWFVLNDPKLSSHANSLIVHPESQIYLSLASVWEISIKASTGRLALTSPVQRFVRDQLSAASIDLLHPTLDDVLHVATLPHHHRDPFDRLLISQSIVQNMPIISADSTFDNYGVNRLW